MLNIIGFVDNPCDTIANSKAVLSSLFTGAGVKVKVIEALGCGTPMSGTDIALEGISAEKFGEYMTLCKNAEDYTKFMESDGKSIEDRLKLKKHLLKVIHQKQYHHIWTKFYK